MGPLQLWTMVYSSHAFFFWLSIVRAPPFKIETSISSEWNCTSNFGCLTSWNIASTSHPAVRLPDHVRHRWCFQRYFYPTKSEKWRTLKFLDFQFFMNISGTHRLISKRHFSEEVLEPNPSVAVMVHYEVGFVGLWTSQFLDMRDRPINPKLCKVTVSHPLAIQFWIDKNGSPPKLTQFPRRLFWPQPGVNVRRLIPQHLREDGCFTVEKMSLPNPSLADIPSHSVNLGDGTIAVYHYKKRPGTMPASPNIPDQGWCWICQQSGRSRRVLRIFSWPRFDGSWRWNFWEQIIIPLIIILTKPWYNQYELGTIEKEHWNGLFEFPMLSSGYRDYSIYDDIAVSKLSITTSCKSQNRNTGIIMSPWFTGILTTHIMNHC